MLPVARPKCLDILIHRLAQALGLCLTQLAVIEYIGASLRAANAPLDQGVSLWYNGLRLCPVLGHLCEQL